MHRAESGCSTSLHSKCAFNPVTQPMPYIPTNRRHRRYSSDSLAGHYNGRGPTPSRSASKVLTAVPGSARTQHLPTDIRNVMRLPFIHHARNSRHIQLRELCFRQQQAAPGWSVSAAVPCSALWHVHNNPHPNMRCYVYGKTTCTGCTCVCIDHNPA